MLNNFISEISTALQYCTSLVKGRANYRLFQGIQTYVMFIGYPRSGHTLIGALLDAHPNMIIAHELNALQYFKRGFSKEQVFSLLLANSMSNAKSGRMWTGYSYAVPNQTQGSFDDLIVIGDKKGGGSAHLLKENPALLDIMEQRLAIPVKYIHVYRNPFDNISTWARGGNLLKKQVTEKELELVISKYCTTAEMIYQLKKDTQIEIIDIKNEDFIERPRELLKHLVNQIGLEASEDYLESCSRIVFKNPNKTRYSMDWSKKHIELVQQKISRYPWLVDYNFEN